MKRFLSMLALVVAGALIGGQAIAEAPKTVSGKSTCGHCSGVTDGDCGVMLVTADGARWMLIGDSESYKAAMKVRSDGKKMTATLAGEPVTKKGKDGKDYTEVKVSEVKIEA